MAAGIYQIRNKVNLKVYVGLTHALDGRWSGHRSELRGGYHSNLHLQRSWDKYGESAFEYSVLQTVSHPGLLDYAETMWIAMKQSSDPKYGYNKTTGGRHSSKLAFSDEAKAKMIAARRSRGPVSAETRAKQSLAARGNTSHKGKRHSEETKAKIGAMSRARKHSPETKAKMSASHKGRVFSEETRAKISAAQIGRPSAMKGKKHSEETKRKMSATQIMRRQKK